MKEHFIKHNNKNKVAIKRSQFLFCNEQKKTEIQTHRQPVDNIKQKKKKYYLAKIDEGTHYNVET